MIKKFNEWFNLYNNKLFNGELPKLQIKTSHGKRRLGSYKFYSGRYKPGIIYISTAYKFDDNKFKSILIHEMIHAYIHYKCISDNSHHGDKFIEIMNEVNEKLIDEGIEITIKTYDLNKYELKNKVKYPFMLYGDSLVRISKSKESLFRKLYPDYKFFYSDNQLLNSLKRSITKLNIYHVEEGNSIYNELIKEGILKKEIVKYNSIEEKKITIYAVHTARDVFNVNISESIMKSVIFDNCDVSVEKCLETIANNINYKLLPISVNGILDSIILLARDMYSNGYGGLNGFDEKYIN